MDLKDQLQHLFPDHEIVESNDTNQNDNFDLWLQDDPLVCKYEKRKGKPITIIDGYNGASDDFKKLTKLLKKTLIVICIFFYKFFSF